MASIIENINDEECECLVIDFTTRPKDLSEQMPIIDSAPCSVVETKQEKKERKKRETIPEFDLKIPDNIFTLADLVAFNDEYAKFHTKIYLKLRELIKEEKVACVESRKLTNTPGRPTNFYQAIKP